MKKQFFEILGIIALAALIGFVFVACDNDTLPRDPIFLSNDINNDVPIYYLDGVTKEQAETIRYYLDEFYKTWSPGTQTNWADGRITKINITTGATVNKEGTVLNIGYQVNPADLYGELNHILVLLHLDNSKETVRLV